MSQHEQTGPEQSSPDGHESSEGVPAVQPPASEASLDPKVAGLLAYLLFGWIGGLIMFFTQKHPEVRFHGAQSVLTSIAFAAVAIGLSIVTTIVAVVPGVGWIAALMLSLLFPLMSLGGFVLFVFLCIKGYNLEHFKLPLIGDIAERWAAS